MVKDLKLAYARGQITFPGCEFPEANIAEQELMAFPFSDGIVRNFYPEVEKSRLFLPLRGGKPIILTQLEVLTGHGGLASTLISRRYL